MVHRAQVTLSMLALVALPAVVEAGPPLICHPFQTGNAQVLPWGEGTGWNTPDRKYDVQRLTSDTLRLLTPQAPILARMENMRRATIYAAQDARIASELLTAVLARAQSTTAAGAADANALFDAGYLVESYKQAAALHRENILFTRDRSSAAGFAGAGDGYSMVLRAIALAGGSPDMEFAASLMKEGAVSAEHLRRATAAAQAGSLLARNLTR